MASAKRRGRKVVVIFADRNDIHAVAVAAEILKLKKAEPVILDTADYPLKWSVAHTIDARNRPSWVIKMGRWAVSSEQLAGVWWRRPKRHRISKQVQDRQVRSFCLDESAAAFRGWLQSLGDLVINPVTSDTAAGRKPYQLTKARDVGLRIPKTLVSNDPDEARRFARQLDGKLIFKVLTGTEWQFTETRRLRKHHARALSNLRHAPAIFQELIEADLDIRVTIIEDKIFAASIRAARRGAQLDWRLDLTAKMKGHRVPAAVKRKLLKLMAALGLRYGAIDLRLTPQGDYVFLEINPGGQFLFCEIHAGLPISQALAVALSSRRRRSHRRVTAARP